MGLNECAAFRALSVFSDPKPDCRMPKLWSNTIYGSGPTAALIYDSKLKRMKNLWRQFVGSHKTIIELWSGISSLRV